MAMRVESISTKEQSPYSVFGSISKGVAGGAITGYAVKYFLPLNKSEMGDEYGVISNTIREKSNMTKGTIIDSIRSIENKTPAQDVFLKMIDSTALQKPETPASYAKPGKGGISAAGESSIIDGRVTRMRKVIKDAKLGTEGMEELRNIIAQVNEKAVITYKQLLSAYRGSIKRLKRPTAAYVTAGAAAGFFAGLAHKVVSSSINA